MQTSSYVKLIVIGVLIIIGVVIVFLCRARLRTQQLPPISEDPIAAIGHGSFLSKDGKPIKLTEPLMRQVQDLYIRKLSDAKLEVREGSVFDEQKINSTKDLIYSTVRNEVLANALYIDWLMEQRKPADEAHFSTANNALRWHYVLTIQQNPILPDKEKRWPKGIPDEDARKLEEKGIVVYAITNAGMPAYVQECIEAGVPVPTSMYGEQWTNLGELENEFISQFNADGVEMRAEVLIHVSTNPEGFCLALPRYLVRGAGNEAELFGVICLGTRRSKACFFDNPRGTFFRKNEVIDFRSNFVGGQDLILNNQGTCTDCHAGENPYVVHPAKRPFMRILDNNLDGDRSDGHVSTTMPLRWHDPIVPGIWPQNPGPMYVLDAVNSPGQCDSCHRVGSSGGRFPDLSFPLPGYCTDVVSNAVRPIASGGTMPYGLEGLPVAEQEQQRTLYEPHINTLTSYCSLTRADGKLETGNIPENPSFISPPMIIAPVYACAKQVAVRGAVLDARATLFINRGLPEERSFTIFPARNPGQIVFTGLPELRVGDVLTAIQEIGGATSSPSEAVTVRNYRDDYPSGVPKPVIDPTTVFACADLIAVRHLPGATITVSTNDADPRSFETGTGWTSIPPAGAPFREMDRFTVRATMCGDTSDPSDPVSARRAPAAPFPLPAFNPPNVYDGQELLTIEDIIFGARVSLRETSSGWSGFFSTPVTSAVYDIKTALSRPLRTTDSLQARQALCDATSDWTSVDEKLHDCERLPAPQIGRPMPNARYVVVYSSVPGARVMVYDASGTEIGDGTGTVIMLSRPIVAGETLRVVQRVGQCTSRFIYVVRAGGSQ